MDQPEAEQPYPPGPPGTPPSPSDRYFQDLTYSRAKNAFLLGFFGFCCFGVLLGVPAIIVGLLALRDINASHGRLRGRGTAITGIVLGCLSLLTSGALVWRLSQGDS